MPDMMGEVVVNRMNVGEGLLSVENGLNAVVGRLPVRATIDPVTQSVAGSRFVVKQANVPRASRNNNNKVKRLRGP